MVSSDVETPAIIHRYHVQGKLGGHRYVYLVEHFEQSARLDTDERTYVVADFADSMALAKTFERIAAEQKIDTVIAIDEFAVYVAALAREALGLAGLNAAQARKFRDKIVMKEALRDSSVNVPTVYSREALDAGDAPFPLIVKPRSLAGSVGVSIVRDTHELRAKTIGPGVLHQGTGYVDMSESHRQVEQFIDGDIYHIDGIARDGVVVMSTLSRYLSTPLRYLSGHPLGSVVVPMSKTSCWHIGLTAEIVQRLGVPDGVFHLEIIKHAHGSPYFLEIGARPGGAQVKRAFAAMTEVDLLLSHIRLQLDLELPAAETRPACQSVGWLIFPKRHDLPPGHIVERIRMPRMALASMLLHRFVPQIGTTASGPFYSHDRTLGTFVFCGDDASVKTDIASFMDHYKVDVSASITEGAACRRALK